MGLAVASRLGLWTGLSLLMLTPAFVHAARSEQAWAEEYDLDQFEDYEEWEAQPRPLRLLGGAFSSPSGGKCKTLCKDNNGLPARYQAFCTKWCNDSVKTLQNSSKNKGKNKLKLEEKIYEAITSFPDTNSGGENLLVSGMKKKGLPVPGQEDWIEDEDSEDQEEYEDY